MINYYRKYLKEFLNNSYKNNLYWYQKIFVVYSKKGEIK